MPYLIAGVAGTVIFALVAWADRSVGTGIQAGSVTALVILTGVYASETRRIADESRRATEEAKRAADASERSADEAKRGVELSREQFERERLPNLTVRVLSRTVGIDRPTMILVLNAGPGVAFSLRAFIWVRTATGECKTYRRTGNWEVVAGEEPAEMLDLGSGIPVLPLTGVESRVIEGGHLNELERDDSIRVVIRGHVEGAPEEHELCSSTFQKASFRYWEGEEFNSLAAIVRIRSALSQ